MLDNFLRYFYFKLYSIAAVVLFSTTSGFFSFVMGDLTPFVGVDTVTWDKFF